MRMTLKGTAQGARCKRLLCTDGRTRNVYYSVKLSLFGCRCHEEGEMSFASKGNSTRAER